MKLSLRNGTIAAALLVLAGNTSFAQLPGSGGNQARGMHPAIMAVVAKAGQFTADATFQAVEAASGQTITLPMKITAGDKRVRTDVDLGSIKSSQLPAEAIAQMKKIGMDQMFTVMRGDQKKMLVVYPNMKSAINLALADSDAYVMDEKLVLQKTKMGTETVDGHPCVKQKVVVTTSEGKKHELQVSEATDMKDFPIKFFIEEDGQKATMTLTNVKKAKPDVALFEIPANFTKYDDLQQFQQALMQRLMGNATPGAAQPAPAPAPRTPAPRK